MLVSAKKLYYYLCGKYLFNESLHNVVVSVYPISRKSKLCYE